MEVQLQSILLPDQQICEVPELYYHEKGNRIAFDGYFNLFYIEKRKAYTNIEGVILSLQLKGYKSIALFHDQERADSLALESEILKNYRIELPYAAYDRGVFWFELERDEACGERWISGSFAGRIEPQSKRNINIGIDICTYRREEYIEKNLKKLKKRFYEQTDPGVGEHLWIYVVDNGKTLDQQEEIQKVVASAHGRIRIIANKNSGGAGGFTRGMLEILREKKRLGLTHVLLMDDDAVVEPDSLVRIYGFLSTVKEEWRDITVGGAMMREDYPYVLYCAGEIWKDGKIRIPQMDLDVRNYSNACCEYLTATGHEQEWYSGWWCCCYSLETVRKDNLPLPLFIHYDDIEFGLRNRKQGIVFLNGVGVWHRGVEALFRGANLYYDVRNNLIETALHQIKAPEKTARKVVFQAFASALVHLKYEDAALIYRGVRDFLKGPAWLHAQEPDRLNTEIRKMGYHLYSLEELKKELPEHEYMAVTEQIQDFRNTFNMDVILAGRNEKKSKKILAWMTLNGWLLPADRQGIQVVYSTDSLYATFRKKKIVLYEVGSGKVQLLQKDYRMFMKVVFLYLKAAWALERGFGRAAASYRKNLKKITSGAAWQKYLKMNEKE